ncbi:MAG: UbiA prenyltransferase family protein [Candidatus Aenigmarchaeota archaeon]|nr:UbiA prenyltransferase family protein [Candidatus Aenigmarchaeota archaeon]
MSSPGDLLRLMRPRQWYKNLFVFAAAFFSGNLFDTHLMALSFIGFVSLCLVSSANYALNDAIDFQRDKLNPEKRIRPIASGKVSRRAGTAFALVLYAIGMSAGYFLGLEFLSILAFFSALTISYSVYFKHVAFLDIIFIGINFVLRAVAGVLIIGVALSPWFFLSLFFLSFYLVLGKRQGELLFLGKKAPKHKPVLAVYDIEIVRDLMQVFMSCLIILYGLYAFFTERLFLLFLYPFLLYALFRFYYLAKIGHPASRELERAFLDRGFLASAVLFGIGLFLGLYVL